MNTKRGVGFILIILAIGITISNVRITGAVIGTSISNSLSLAALVLFVVGILLIITEEGGLERKIQKTIREIDQTLRSGRIGNYRELEHYAIKLGYEIKEGKNHKSVYKGTHFITQIPRHARGVVTGTYRGILKDLRDYALAAA